MGPRSGRARRGHRFQGVHERKLQPLCCRRCAGADTPIAPPRAQLVRPIPRRRRMVPPHWQTACASRALKVQREERALRVLSVSTKTCCRRFKTVLHVLHLQAQRTRPLSSTATVCAWLDTQSRQGPPDHPFNVRRVLPASTRRLWVRRTALDALKTPTP